MATALAASGAAAVESAAIAQTQPNPASAAPMGDLAAVHAQLQRNAQQLAEVKLPRATEPAFQFKA